MQKGVECTKKHGKHQRRKPAESKQNNGTQD